jgi:benzoyl-CoA reductase/2-hydroxyglutaryl-CoA dehydratase subunit BcrC/BadD/HgdB
MNIYYPRAHGDSTLSTQHKGKRCGLSIIYKDGNGYPLSTCPRVKKSLGMNSDESVPTVWVAFDIHGYLQNG